MDCGSVRLDLAARMAAETLERTRAQLTGWCSEAAADVVQ